MPSWGALYEESAISHDHLEPISNTGMHRRAFHTSEFYLEFNKDLDSALAMYPLKHTKEKSLNQRFLNTMKLELPCNMKSAGCWDLTVETLSHRRGFSTCLFRLTEQGLSSRH